MRRIVTATLLLLLIPAAALAQAGEFEWFPGGTYDQSVPTPSSFLGYEIGMAYTWHRDLLAYCERVAETSDRVTMTTYGQSYEGRDLVLMFISSQANHARLEEIRANMATLADPRGRSQSELNAIIQNSPAVAWLSYNVHGSESAGTEAAILTIYQLAAGTDAVTSRILDELVVVIDPLQNPDGRDRFVADFKARKGKTYDASPDAWEHSTGWPGGRTNHYLFDLNRDWAWQTQQETRQRITAYFQWNPVVHVDFHEMGGDSYFFFPAATPVHKAYPDVIKKWQKIYGEGNAAAFDAFGWPYYTKVGFDMFYPSYGDSWPSMMGAIGMTYEQGGGGGVGIVVERDDGTTHSLRQRAHGHFTTSMATLKTTAENRSAQLTDFLAFFRQAIALGDGPIKSYALVPATGHYNINRMIERLLANGIEVTRAEEAFRARVQEGFGVYTAPSSRQFPAGTFLVAAGQPKGVALRMLMEPMPALEDTSFYDLAGWSLPLVHSVEAYALAEVPGVRSTPVTETPGRVPGRLEGDDEAYAWTIEYDGPDALFAANDLLNRGLRVSSASEKFTSGGREYGPGTFLIPRYRNPENTRDILEQVCAEWGVTARPLASGLVEEGTDLGGRGYNSLEKPKIAVAAGQSAGSFSEAWHFFDEFYPYFDFTLIDASRLTRTDLDDYNVLILPGGSFSDLTGEAGIDQLRSWLQGGGVVIAWDGSAAALAQGGAGLASIDAGSGGRGGRGGGGGMGGAQGAPPGGAGGQPRGGAGGGQRTAQGELAIDARMTIAERRAQGGAARTPGSMYGIALDPDHWVAYGMPERMAIMKRGSRSFSLTTRGTNVAVFVPDPLLSGYAPASVTRELATRAWLVEESVGQGKLVLFADDPLFRMFVEGGHQFVLNAIVLGPGY